MAEVISTELVEQCKKIVKNKIEESNNPIMFFHNWEHTLNVYDATTEIAGNTKGITDKELKLMQIAALFHDVTACVESCGHEQKAADLAQLILTEKAVSAEAINFVKRLILATKLSHKPFDIFECIIKDADLSHLRKGTYIREPFVNLFKEISASRKLTPTEWVAECIDFFDKNTFYTTYAKENFQAGKEKNKEKLKELLQMEINTLEDLETQTAKVKKKKKEKKNKIEVDVKSDKGIENMFRIELRNHLTLSRIADDKANTLISVNAIVISIVLSALFPKLDNNPYLTFPALSLLVSSIVTIIISIISTIPRTTHGLLTKEDVINRKGNLVFFGNFHNMDLEDFEWGIEEFIHDKDFLYKTLTRDLYFLGKVLKKKYAYLRIGYLTFVVGLIFSSFVFVFKIFSNYV
jgi:hypothetical protein